MFRMVGARRVQVLVLLLCIGKVSLAGGVEFDPVNLLVQSDGSLVLCGNYYDPVTADGGYWFWRVNERGEKIWERRLSGEGTDVVDVVRMPDGRFVALLSVYSGSKGYKPMLQLLEADGKVSQRVSLNAHGIARVLYPVSESVLLIGGASDSYSRAAKHESGSKTDRSDLDAWLLSVEADGTILTQNWLDRGRDESIYDLVRASDGTLYCLGNTGELNKLGGGLSDAWLFGWNAEEGVVTEAMISKGRLVKGGRMLTLSKERLTTVCSLPQSPGEKNSEACVFTFPARIDRFSLDLKSIGSPSYVSNAALSTPALAMSIGGGVYLASAGSDAPVLTAISAEGALGAQIKGEAWSFAPFMSIDSLQVAGSRAYVLGSVTDVVSDQDDSAHVFIAVIDLDARKLLWQRTY